MGWFIFQKLVKSQSPSAARRTIPLINKPILLLPLRHTPPTSSSSSAPPLSPFSTTSSSETRTTAFKFPFPPEEDWSFNHSPSSPSHHYFFPSFSFGFFLNPNSSAGGLIITDVDGGCDSEDSPATVWADSVKKKRKRKMNKHKLRKLRKRLRRKT